MNQDVYICLINYDEVFDKERPHIYSLKSVDIVEKISVQLKVLTENNKEQ